MTEAQRISWIGEQIRFERVKPVKLLQWPRKEMLLTWTMAMAVEF